jgi:predicted nucleic acid-binding Zn ribbon protein
MARRKRVSKQKPKKKMNWTTTIWYVIGALIVIAMVFSLVASAFN